MEEFHIDGFRLDATHAISDESPRHILEEIATDIHEHGGFSIAEDARNEARLLLSPRENGFGFDAVWADDFHHTMRVLFTGESESYFKDFDGSQHQVIETLRNGWLYRGQYSQHRKAKRGTECRHVAPQKFVHCISNHDQVGNRAFGDRLSPPAEAYRAASALLCLTPYTPMFFMGQEWAASTPFQFFTDHNEELGALVTKGRRAEFKEFSAFHDKARLAEIPDPQSPRTFQDSKLNWAELKQLEKRGIFDLYRAFLHLRNSHACFRPESRETWRVEELAIGGGAIRFQAPGMDWLVLFDLEGGHGGSLADDWICKLPGGRPWQRVLSSNESRFGGTLVESFDPEAQRVSFNKPELLVLNSSHE
jgi:maltooligosyltrehalose trehalohydrolase